jgi:hypothetical protein
MNLTDGAVVFTVMSDSKLIRLVVWLMVSVGLHLVVIGGAVGVIGLLTETDVEEFGIVVLEGVPRVEGARDGGVIS